MIPRPPRSPRTDTLFPYTTLFRALVPCIDAKRVRDGDREANGGLPPLVPAIPVRDGDDQLVLTVGGVGRVDIEHVVAVAIDVLAVGGAAAHRRSEEHTSELQSLMRISYAVFCLKKTKAQTKRNIKNNNGLTPDLTNDQTKIIREPKTQ